MGPAVLKTVARRAKRLGCVRFTYVPANSFTKTTTKVTVPNVVVLTTGTKQLRNTDFAGQVLKNASTCIVIKTKHLLVCLCETFPQQCDIIHTR